MIDARRRTFVIEKQGTVAGPRRATGATARTATTNSTAGPAARSRQGSRRQLARWRRDFSAARLIGCPDSVQRDSRRPRDAGDRRGRGVHRSQGSRTATASSTSIGEPDRGTGTIICNVQRYNPTPRSSRPPSRISASRPRRATTRWATAIRLTRCRFPSPVGPDAIPNCVPMNIFGQGNVSDAAADVRASRRSPASAP